MKGKLTVLLTLVIAASLALTACAAPATTAAPQPTQPPAPTSAPPTKAPEPTKAPAPAATQPPAPPAAPETGAPYKIGAFFSTTGPVSSLGQPEADTVTMLVKQINDAGGILGPDGKLHLLEVPMYDDQSDSTKAVEVVKKLIEEDKVLAIVGGTGSGQSLAVINTVQAAEIPFISVASSSAIVLPVADKKWIFKTPQQNLPVAQVQVDYLLAKGITKVASIGVNNPFGTDSIKALKEVAPTAGIEIVADELFAAGDTDFSAQLANIAASGGEALVVHATPGEGAPLTVQFRDLGLDIPSIHNHGIGNQAFIDTGGEAAEGVLFPIGKLLIWDQLPADDPQYATLKQYVDDYTTAYGKLPSTFGGHAWDGIMMLKLALEAHGADPASIRGFLTTKVRNFIGISGVFNITPDDHNGIGKESLVLVMIKAGGWVYVPPADYANVP
ncbi:MAG: ABC transporter substrate-binding protein [Chloroflexi bacterium]|nr:ABC transporter substrate-binding protein [Chloroflexota bacterium]